MNSYGTEITQILCPSPGTIAIIDWQELGFTKRNSHQAPSAPFITGSTLLLQHTQLCCPQLKGTRNRSIAKMQRPVWLYLNGY